MLLLLWSDAAGLIRVEVARRGNDVIRLENGSAGGLKCFHSVTTALYLLGKSELFKYGRITPRQSNSKCTEALWRSLGNTGKMSFEKHVSVFKDLSLYLSFTKLFGLLPVIVNFLPLSLFTCFLFGLDNAVYLNTALSSLSWSDRLSSFCTL